MPNSSDTQLIVFADSSWFIDFQDGIDETFLGDTADMSTSRNVFSILLSQNLACKQIWICMLCFCSVHVD